MECVCGVMNLRRSKEVGEKILNNWARLRSGGQLSMYLRMYVHT